MPTPNPNTKAPIEIRSKVPKPKTYKREGKQLLELDFEFETAKEAWTPNEGDLLMRGGG